MKKLIITANPSSKGFTNTITKKYKELSENNGDNVEVIDLYTPEFKQDYLSYEDIREFELDDTSKKIQDMISKTDELIFIFPIWWGDMPAVMKNFWDINFSSGFAYKYENGKSVGLLGTKSARIIATSGAPSFFYKIILHIQLVWNLNRIKFCGMKQKSFTVFGGIHGKNKDISKIEKDLEKLV